MKIKRDKYFRERGSYSRIIKIFCKKCGKLIFSYQKDGSGWLKRCYFNRIISDRKFSSKRNLICSSCQTIIGKPKRHIFRSDEITPDGRWSFELCKEKFRRTYGKKIK